MQLRAQNATEDEKQTFFTAQLADMVKVCSLDSLFNASYTILLIICCFVLSFCLSQPAPALLQALLSLPLNKDEIAKQEKVLLFMTDLLKESIAIPSLSVLVALSPSLQQKAEELSEQTSDEEEDEALTRLSLSAAAFSQAAEAWAKKHPDQGSAQHGEETKEEEEKEKMKKAVEESTNTIRKHADTIARLQEELRKKEEELTNARRMLNPNEVTQPPLKPFPPGEEGEWSKTPIAPDRKCVCSGLAVTPTHSLAVLSEWARKGCILSVAFSPPPFTRPWTLRTLAMRTNFTPCPLGSIAIGNGFCVFAGHADFKKRSQDDNRLIPTSIRIFFSSSSSPGGEWKWNTIFNDSENECKSDRAFFAGDIFFVIGKG